LTQAELIPSVIHERKKYWTPVSSLNVVITMRKFLLAVIILLAILFAISRFAEVQQMVSTLQQGDPVFILLAIAAMILWYLVLATFFRLIYQNLGMIEKTRHMALLALAAYFVNIIAPSGGVSGITVFISDARKRGRSTGRVTVAGALYVLFDYLGFLVILTLGLAVLARRNSLHWAEISASIIIVIGAFGISTLLYLGAKSEKILGAVLSWFARLINKVLYPLLHRPYLSEERAHSFACEAAEGMKALKTNPREWLKIFFLAVLNKAMLLGVFTLCFLAFRIPYTTGILVAGWSIGYLFLIVSPTPSGIGIVEGVMTLTLNSLGVPLAAAAIIVIAYRGITFWLPLLGGMIAFRQVSRAAPAASD
jgi:uncharacterized protein (TIRG00374 family)